MKYILAFLFLTLIAGSSAQSTVCTGAVAFCGSSVFVPGTSGSAEGGFNYGCLNSQPAPAWFFFQIATGNNITVSFTNTQSVDIDYAIWGPFVQVEGACAALSASQAEPVSCSFSGSAVETAVLTTVNPGEIYLMLVTNFAQANTVIQVNVDMTTTNGDLNCLIVSPSATQTPVIAPSASASPSDRLGDVCADSDAFCGLSSFNPGTQGDAQAGPNYGCLLQQPAPAWFNFQIATGNNITIDFTNTNQVDIDYAIWGPFNTVDCPQVESGLVGPISCSFSGSGVERAVLTNVNPGEFYLMLITNFARQPTVITANVDRTNTNGDLNCLIVSPTATPTPAVTASASPSDRLGELCVDADPFCGLSTFNPGTQGDGQFGPNYGCLLQQPAPAWFFFRIGRGNNITIDFTNLNQVDIDYAIWGPFDSSDCAQVESGQVGPISCSFSGSGTERAVLTNINPGEFYIMIITNFARQTTIITANVDFTNTNGDLDCGIVPVSASPSFSPSTSFTSSPSFTPSTTPSTSFSPSTSLSNSITPTRSESNSITPTRSATSSPSESNTASPSRTPSGSISETRSATPSISLTRSTTPTRSPTRSPTGSPTPSRTTRRSRSQTPTTTPTPSISRSNRASRSSTPTISLSPIPRTTGLRTTGVDVPRTTGVEVARTTGARTTGVVNRTTGTINRTTGVNPSSTPSQSEIIISSSAAFSASPFFSLIFVVVALAFTIIA